MGKGAEPPPAPDPVAVAAAQEKTNVRSATAQTGLNSTNQVTPYGNLSYTQIGNWQDGTPHFQAEQTLSPEQQTLLSQQNEYGRLTGQLGIDQTKKLADLLSKPVDLSNDATEAAMMQRGRMRLDPMMQQRREGLENKLYNQGVRPGTEAWQRAMTEVGQQENDAYNQLMLQGRGQAVQEALTARNQPINEITALMSGGQVSQPNFVGTPQSQVAATDYMGAVGMQQAALQNNYNQQMGQQNAIYGALGSAAGGIGGGMMMKSDRRAKTNIKRVGELDNGLSVYSFRYIGSDMTQIGLMADEVEQLHPEAVVEIGGVKHVYYDRAVI